MMGLIPPMPIIGWVADSDASNCTTHYPSNISSPRPPSFSHLSSIIVGNGSILFITSLGGLVLPRPFYLDNILVAPNLI
jgi:hypothetical protein